MVAGNYWMISVKSKKHGVIYIQTIIKKMALDMKFIKGGVATISYQV